MAREFSGDDMVRPLLATLVLNAVNPSIDIDIWKDAVSQQSVQPNEQVVGNAFEKRNVVDKRTHLLNLTCHPFQHR